MGVNKNAVKISNDPDRQKRESLPKGKLEPIENMMG